MSSTLIANEQMRFVMCFALCCVFNRTSDNDIVECLNLYRARHSSREVWFFFLRFFSVIFYRTCINGGKGYDAVLKNKVHLF